MMQAEGPLENIMLDFPNLRQELESHVLTRTGRRVLGLDIKLSPECVILRGRTNTFYIKQLAQQGVREILPDVRLENAIEVA
jgi:hypothetical protein